MVRGRAQAPRGGRERSQRQLRVGETIRHALVEILARDELRDPDLVGASITVTEVRVSPDLRNASVFVLPLGGERTVEIVAALQRAAPFLRRQVGQALTMKYLPDLSFLADTAFDARERIDSLLRSPEVLRDISGRGHSDDEEPPDGS